MLRTHRSTAFRRAFSSSSVPRSAGSDLRDPHVSWRYTSHRVVSQTFQLTVFARERVHVLAVEAGTTVRGALLDAGLSPYAPLARRLNCGVRGLCATCGVRVLEPAPPPIHCHDRLAAAYGYPRLSCQVRVDSDLSVALLAHERRRVRN